MSKHYHSTTICIKLFEIFLMYFAVDEKITQNIPLVPICYGLVRRSVFFPL